MRLFKKNLIFIALIGLAILIVACSSDNTKSSDKDGETITLRASSGLPSDHIWEVIFFKPWIERVEEESGGRVKIDYFNNAELVDLGAELDALKAGTIDIGTPIMSIYDPKRFPLTEVSMLPVIGADTDVVNDAYYNMFYSDQELKDGKTFYELEIEKNGLKSFPISAGYPYVINTTGKKFDSVSDFKNAKIRIATRTHEMLLKRLGASPINMSINDTYDSLSRGALDGTIMAVEDWTTWGFQDQLKYGLEGAMLGYVTSVMGMSEDKWNSLPEDIQEIMQKAADDIFTSEDTIAGIYNIIDEEHEKVEEVAELEQFTDLNPDVQAHMEEAMAKSWLDWIETLDKQGDPGKEIAKLWRDSVLEAGGEVPDSIKELE